MRPSPDQGGAGFRENLSDVDLASSGSRGRSSNNNLMDSELEHDMNDDEPERGGLLYSFDDNDEEIEWETSLMSDSAS